MSGLLSRIAGRARSGLSRTALRLGAPVRARPGAGRPVGRGSTILDQYVMAAPDPQNALDIFKNEWSSRLPGPWAHLRSGTVPVFEDPRVTWFAEQVGGLGGKAVLELGPLEGGHTYMLEQLGAASILAIEANTRAYLRCLIVKEILGLRRARFACGSFTHYLRGAPGRFDVVLASGVLYHMAEPVELIELMGRASDCVCCWTHYYDRARLEREAWRFARPEPRTHAGFAHTVHPRTYGDSLHWSGFRGGGQPYSGWLSREDLLGAFQHFGFRNVRIGFDDPDHANGPSLALVATRTPAP